MLELNVDRENKKLHAVLELHGEEKPIAVDVAYDIALHENRESAEIRATSISISREWMDRVAQEFVGQEFLVEGKGATRVIKLLKDIGLV